MCGIFGYITSDDSRATDFNLDVAIKALGHRGPDDSGEFVSRHKNVWCGLAQTRLSILDLSHAGHQPMTTANGRYSIVYNGEIYNFKEVRDELEELGQSFRSNCDTEVVLEAYARWGEECLSRFRGMFAFAIWDDEQDKLFIARDRLGIKPLYYALTPKGIVFSSEIRTLLATGLIDRKVSHSGLASYLAFGSVADPHTFIEGIFSLEPGHYAEYHDGTFNYLSYWQIPQEIDNEVSYSVAVEALHALLRDAIRMQLVADVPVGVFLSGGIDSSAILALAREALQDELHTFTVTFDEEIYNEAPFAAEVARTYEADHHQVHLSTSRIASDIGCVIKALDQPSADGVNTFFVARAAREAGLKVVLSGLGGDEVFAGYKNFRQFKWLLLLTNAARLLPQHLLGTLLAPNAFNGRANRLHKLAALLETNGQPEAVYSVMRGMFMPQQQESLRADQKTGVKQLSQVQLIRGVSSKTVGDKIDPINSYSSLEISNYLSHTLLRDTDVMSMAHGLEVRVPLLDHRVVEQASRLPGRFKIDGARNKPLLIDAVGGLSQNIVLRKKMGFTIPLGECFRGALRPWAEDILLGQPSRQSDFLNAQAVERLWKSFLRGDQYTSYTRVWSMLALMAWCTEHRVNI